jgi:hypothetical protein
MRWRCALLAATLAVTVASPADAQTPVAPRTTFCLEERGPQQCWATVLLSPAIHAIAGTSGDWAGTGGPSGSPVRIRHFKPMQYTLSLALLRDIRQRDAIGGFLQVGLANKQQVRVAAGGRYRWRLGDRVAIDASPGLVHMQIPGEGSSGPADHEPRIGGTTDLDLHLDHWAILTTRLDVIPTKYSGTAVGFGAGLKVDGSPGNGVVVGLIATALVMLAYAALYISIQD